MTPKCESPNAGDLVEGLNGGRGGGGGGRSENQ